MPIDRANSIDRLYDECRDYDLVVVPDAPLAGGLNRRLDRAHLGPFATTPRRLVVSRRGESEARRAFLEVVTETDLGWKQASFAVRNVLQCWKHEGVADAILEYDAFDTEPTRTVLETIEALDTDSARLADYTIDPETDVAVVGRNRLTELERSVLPEGCKEVSPFADATFDPPPFHVFDSPAAIVDALLDTITPENADRVAVVLDRDGAYSPLVRSAFQAADVPYYGGPRFIDDPERRTFLRLLRAAHAGRDARVSRVRPVLDRLGAGVAVEHDRKRLHELDQPAATWLTEFQEGIGEYTFGGALAAYEAATGADLDALRGELTALGVADEPVTDAAVDRLAFYLQSYEVPVEREDDGVLLADPTSAAYVDRPLVFYLGLDQSWTRTPARRPWVDREREHERHLRQFQLLLQNGVEQYYLVQDAAGGAPVSPCLYFEDLLDGEFQRFSDLDSVPHTRTFRETGSGFETETVDAEPQTVESVSQSSLNAYVNCPRDYLFGRVVDGPEREYFVEGNLFHDFAEFYVTHPDAVDDETVEEVVDAMVEELGPFVRDVDRDVRRTRYRVGVETIVEFLDANPPEPAEFLTPASSRGENFFARYFGRPVDAPHTERWFENDALGVKGKIDLVHGPTHLLDYKTGSKSSAYSVVKNSALDPPADAPDFQALLYLAHLRTRRPGERLQFTLFHFLETLDDALAGDADLADCLTRVTYYPVSFEEHAASREVFDDLVTDGPNDCRKTLDQVAYEDYRAVLAAHEFPDTRDSDELVASDLGRALTAEMRERVGDYKYVDNGCAQVLRELRDVRDRNYFVEDLDAFEAFVAEHVEELNRRRAGEERFPVEGPGGEPNYRRVDNRDLLLETDD